VIRNKQNSARVSFGASPSDLEHNQLTVKSDLTSDLEIKVFFHDYYGFNSNSTLIYGERDAILISATFLLSDAHRLTAGILDTEKNLTHILLPEFHPDHHFGAEVLQRAFPEAKVVATRSVAKDILYSADDKIELWGNLFGKDVPSRLYFPMPLADDHLELEGHRLEITDGWQADMANETMVWIPSMRAAVPTDMVVYKVFAWTIESDVERRKLWKADLKRLRKMEPAIVIPGHALRDTFTSDPTATIDYTLDYLNDFDEILAGVKTGDELVAGIEKKYPYTGMRFGLHWQARFLFPDSCSDHILPVPGIFHDPEQD
jgi:glyoxylase-like metal-dependent hydrolase (beta-lactamase superfamily II)